MKKTTAPTKTTNAKRSKIQIQDDTDSDYFSKLVKEEDDWKLTNEDPTEVKTTITSEANHISQTLDTIARQVAQLKGILFSEGNQAKQEEDCKFSGLQNQLADAGTTADEISEALESILSQI